MQSASAASRPKRWSDSPAASRAACLFRKACSRTTRSPLNVNTKANGSSTAISLAGPAPLCERPPRPCSGRRSAPRGRRHSRTGSFDSLRQRAGRRPGPPGVHHERSCSQKLVVVHPGQTVAAERPELAGPPQPRPARATRRRRGRTAPGARGGVATRRPPASESRSTGHPPIARLRRRTVIAARPQRPRARSTRVLDAYK